MNEKLKNIAMRFEDIIEEYKTPQEVYNSLMQLVKSQPDYFTIKGPQLIIQLTYLIYSYKNTQGFELGEKMLNDNEFIFVLYSHGHHHEEPCEACFINNGYVNCDECDGTGELNCDECDGHGTLTCETCYGSGIDPESEDDEECWDCNGSGDRTCWKCNGNEITDCPECVDGLVNCEECDGVGTTTTDELEYTIEVIMTWDKSLIDVCKETSQTLVPIMSYKEFDNLKNCVFMNTIEGNNLDFKKGFRENEVYCFDYADNPRLELSRNYNEIKPQGSWRNIASYE
jgi:hypothetical protein